MGTTKEVDEERGAVYVFHENTIPSVTVNYQCSASASWIPSNDQLTCMPKDCGQLEVGAFIETKCKSKFLTVFVFAHFTTPQNVCSNVHRCDS